MKVTSYNLFSRDALEHGKKYAIEHSYSLGFEGVEFFDNLFEDRIGNDTTCDLKTAKKMLKERNLTVACYSILIPDIASPDYTEEEILKNVYRNVDYAAELESPFFHHTIVSKYYPTGDEEPFDEVFDRTIERVDKVAKYCNEKGLICLYEPQGLYYNGLNGLGKLLREMLARGNKVGICGDMGNSLFADTNPSDIYKTFKDHIKHVHVKDYHTSYKPISDIYKSIGGRYLDDATPGEGIVDIEGCLNYIKGYDGTISLESPQPNDEAVLRDIAFVREVYERVNVK